MQILHGSALATSQMIIDTIYDLHKFPTSLDVLASISDGVSPPDMDLSVSMDGNTVVLRIYCHSPVPR